MRTVCCLCNRTKDQDSWVDDVAATHQKLSHGYCPDCFQKTIQQIRNNNACLPLKRDIKNRLA